jgi:isopentenyl-diphosphate Delta-isomerase
MIEHIKDNERGTASKLEAHRKGLLHRAFSVFVFNSKGELLLQKRATSKYHSGGLWSNTCCSHPLPGESPAMGAHRRLREEMGFMCMLHYAFSFVYRAELDNDLIEPNPQEVSDYKWISMNELEKQLKENPSAYTTWLRIVFDRVNEHMQKGAANSSS